ncbi:hypothetical protein BQ8482_110327 [Mesorhizobium delmotii]|uniref:Uncharacterized protein n=1 Tax=Mesorhizobium delmotii TaxID=1631247 RepID=A0A2P9ABE2_9HYPH|nr:hypothetical protein BQ8482_110327 [Mesorhizobium delmotii]
MPWAKIRHSAANDSNVFTTDHRRYYALSPLGYFALLART